MAIKQCEMKALPCRATLFIVLNLLLGIAVSCVNQIEIDLPRTEKQVVVNCLFTDSEKFTVNLCYTGNIFDEDFESIPNASVFLYSDNICIDQFKNSGNGIYVSNVNATTNTPYELRVFVPGYDTLKARDTIPSLTIPSNIRVTDSAGMQSWGGYYSEYAMLIEDNGNKQNYYETWPWYEYTYTPLSSEEDSISIIDDIIWEYDVHDPVLLNENILEYNPKTFLFSDDLFNGQKYNIKIPFEKRSQILYICLNSVSHNYYLYMTTLYKHLYNQTGRALDFMVIDAGNPLTMYSNIENGTGIFAAYNSYITEIKQ